MTDVAPSATLWHMTTPQPISQRDLRQRSKEIMDGVEAGESFVVTRDGREIGELLPLRRQRRFVPRDDFMSISRGAPDVDLDAFMADVRDALDDEVKDPYAR